VGEATRGMRLSLRSAARLVGLPTKSARLASSTCGRVGGSRTASRLYIRQRWLRCRAKRRERRQQGFLASRNVSGLRANKCERLAFQLVADRIHA